jgi:hypothetical protein
LNENRIENPFVDKKDQLKDIAIVRAENVFCFSRTTDLLKLNVSDLCAYIM